MRAAARYRARPPWAATSLATVEGARPRRAARAVKLSPRANPKPISSRSASFKPFPPGSQPTRTTRSLERGPISRLAVFAEHPTSAPMRCNDQPWRHNSLARRLYTLCTSHSISPPRLQKSRHPTRRHPTFGGSVHKWSHMYILCTSRSISTRRHQKSATEPTRRTLPAGPRRPGRADRRRGG